MKGYDIMTGKVLDLFTKIILVAIVIFGLISFMG